MRGLHLLLKNRPPIDTITIPLCLEVGKENIETIETRDLQDTKSGLYFTIM